MALDESALPELLDALRAGDGVDLIRDAVRLVMQELIELEATEVIGAGRYERTETRTNERNGHRPRLLATQAGDIELKIPKLSHGSFFPSLLSTAPADRSGVARGDHAGLRRRRLDPLGRRSGAGVGDRLGDLQVAGVADLRQARCRGRRVPQPDRSRHVEFPYVYLDATYVKARDTDLHQVVSRAVVIATGITADGDREVLGLAVGDSRGGDVLDRVPALAAPPRAGRCAAGDLRRPRRLEDRGPQDVAGRAAGSDAVCTSPATSWPASPKATKTSSPPRCGPCSCTPTRPRSPPPGTAPPTCSPASSPK